MLHFIHSGSHCNCSSSLSTKRQYFHIYRVVWLNRSLKLKFSLAGRAEKISGALYGPNHFKIICTCELNMGPCPSSLSIRPVWIIYADWVWSHMVSLHFIYSLLYDWVDNTYDMWTFKMSDMSSQGPAVIRQYKWPVSITDIRENYSLTHVCFWIKLRLCVLS